jgi:hypothetical protein
MFDEGFSFAELTYRFFKYLIEGLAVAIAAYYLPRNRSLGFDEIAMIAITAAATFALLDMYTPSVGAFSRAGAGLSIGANLAGFAPGAMLV